MDALSGVGSAALETCKNYNERAIVKAERRAIFGPHDPEIVAGTGTGDRDAVCSGERAVEVIAGRVAAAIGMQAQVRRVESSLTEGGSPNAMPGNASISSMNVRVPICAHL